MSKTPRSAVRWTGNLLILLVSTALSMWALDSYISLTQPVSVAYVYEPDTDYQLKQRQDFRFKMTEFDVRVTTNSFGLRGSEPDLNRPCRVMMLGDSFTFGQGVEDDQTFSAVLQSRLDQAYPGLYTVLNTGVNGWDTRREAAYLERMGPVFRPQVVVTSFVLNDPMSNSGEYWFSPIPTNALRYLPFEGVAALLEYLRRNPAELLFKLGLPVDWSEANHFACLRDDDACPRAWEATAREFARISEKATALGATSILVNIPVREQLPGEHPPVPSDGGVPGRHLAKVATITGMDFIDLQQEPDLKPEHFYQRDEHFRPSGHTLAADRMFTRVIEHTQSCRAAPRR